MDSPIQIELYPALAQMIYRGDVKAGDIISARMVHIPGLAEGKLGFEEIFKQDYDVKSFGGFIPQTALAAGRVVVEFTDKFEPTVPPDLKQCWDTAKKIVCSTTGQLIWDYSGKGFFTVNTPGTKAVVGFAAGQQHILDEVSITIETPFAVVFVSSLEKDK